MPRVDDYISARKIAAEKLSEKPFRESAKGFETPESETIRVPFLGRSYWIRYPQFAFIDETSGEKEIPIQEQVLILHYMLGEKPARLSEKWIAYREIPGASFYFGPFTKRAADPLKKVFGENLDGFAAASAKLGGKAVDYGDTGFEFEIFPKVPIRLILWKADEEFPPEAAILFDETIGKILSPEDIAWLSGMLVYRLIALSRS